MRCGEGGLVAYGARGDLAFEGLISMVVEVYDKAQIDACKQIEADCAVDSGHRQY